MRALEAWARLACACTLAAAGNVFAASVAYEEADAPATVAAAEAAVARLGTQRGHPVQPTVRKVLAQVRNVTGLARGVQATVQALESAKRDLGAQENDIEVRIALPADVLFDVDKADIRSDAAQALTHLATVIRGYSGPARLLGHTDTDGSDAHNLDLSRRRADSVKRWLVEKGAIDAARLATEGLGESVPAAPNDTPENKQRNRRVEVIIRKR